jgi:multiple sugar transport system permease protein
MKNTKHISKKFTSELSGYVFILPWIIGFLFLILIPFLCLIYFSFTKYDLLSAPKFIGLRNYINIFTIDTKFLTSLGVTFTYVFAGMPIRLIVALLIAMLLNTRHRLIGLYRTLFYFPSIIGGSIAVAITWRNLFARDGAVNSVVFKLFGINPNISWLADPKTALWSLVLMAVWQFGSPMLIFLAGLKNIPLSYYEAATVDGAGSIKKFFKITLPLLSPVIFFNLIMQLIGGFMTFTQALVITNGGPLDKTLFYQLYVYRKGFEQYSFGYASALSCILVVIISFFAALVFKSSSAWVYYESKD